MMVETMLETFLPADADNAAAMETLATAKPTYGQ
jgi:hypothetical protein